ncbi:MAG TPA: DUF4407 domain-containing protein [Pseudonocardia sp.]|nr:DUF4407 domain-containing protein [Pseudonocardia sp.]
MTEDPRGHEPLSDAGIEAGSRRPGDLMVWLGGGDCRDIGEAAERSAYQATGFVVLIAAVAAWGVATGAVVTAGGLALPAAAASTLLVGLFVGALGRVLATAPGRRGTLLGLGTVAVLVGAVLGELAALTIFTGPIAEQLNVQADRAATSVAAGGGAGRLAQLRAERAGLDDRVAGAGSRRDAALVVARCEYHPAPGCPAQLITGQPGRGPEAEQARAELAGADADLAAARAERDRRVPGLDAAITAAAERVDRDREVAETLARADTGLVARWEAMNGYTLGSPVALIPRLGAVLVMVLLTAAPLLLRLWRGQTDQERSVSARRMRRRAEEDADTAIAVRRAQVRAELELRRQEDLLALGADERHVLGGRADVEQAAAVPTAPAVPAVPAVTTLPERTALPAAADSEAGVPGTAVAIPRRGGPLDLLPGPLPVIGRAVSGMAGAFVPAPVARFVEGTRPMRVMRTLMEDVEEFQFTMVRKRKVTVTEEHFEDAPEPGGAEAPDSPRRSVLLTRVLRDIGGRGHQLPADRAGEITVDAEPAGLESRVRELPAGDESR